MTYMNAFELDFYEAGILDAHEAKHNVLACRSKRYAELSRKHNVQPCDKRGNSVNSYIAGVQFELDRMFKLGII